MDPAEADKKGLPIVTRKDGKLFMAGRQVELPKAPGSLLGRLQAPEAKPEATPSAATGKMTPETMKLLTGLLPALQTKQAKVFNTVQDAEKSGLPKGTEIIVGGRRAIIE
jgi:hypothetical protein